MVLLGLIGNGFVGGAARQLACEKNTVIVYDKDPSRCEPPSTTLNDIAHADIVFVAVPTPAKADGTCHTDIVELVVSQLKERNSRCNIYIRSTCPPGTARRLGCHFMPEFLTEANANVDFQNNRLWIQGVNDTTDAHILQTLLTNAKNAGKIKYDTVRQMSTDDAELVKYVRNCFLGVKVSFFNEVEAYCRQAGLNYEAVRTAACNDTRIGESHTMVPGPDGRRGFGGHCFPKDIAAWCSFAPSELSIVQAAYRKNVQLDRPERDWEADVGRAVIK